MRFVKAAIIAFQFLLLLTSTVTAQPELLGVLKTDTEDTEFGRRIISIGDQNGDGFDDIIIHEKWRNLLFFGGDPFDSLPVMIFGATEGRSNNLGDVNGDGFDDFSFLGLYDYGNKLHLYFGGPFVDTVRDLWFGLDTMWGFGYSIRGLDIDNNGVDEIVTWEGEGQQSVILFELGGDSDSIPDLEILSPDSAFTHYTFGEGIAAGGFNGDGRLDLAVSWTTQAQNETNGAICLYWGGPGFDTSPNLVLRRIGPFLDGANRFGRILECLGDMNGDGHDDLFASAGGSYDDTVGFVYYGGPTIDSFPDVVIPTYHDKARAAGDINDDGYQDLIVSFSTMYSSIGWVEIFLGGPEMDSIPDFRFDVRDTPTYHHYYGLDCSGIGDFNGDGIDDFAFSCSLGGGNFIVYIYSGWDHGTAVDYEYEPMLPSGYSLSQNYPNPFNASTTIEFSLPERVRTDLTVYNIKGEVVATLIGRLLLPGTYRLAWDGKDQAGQVVASGVYLYQLTTGEYVQSRKMLLLK